MYVSNRSFFKIVRNKNFQFLCVDFGYYWNYKVAQERVESSNHRCKNHRRKSWEIRKLHKVDG